MMSMISEQVKELREFEIEWLHDVPMAKSIMRQAADTIEELFKKLEANNVWIPCSEPPKHDREVVIFNGKSCSVRYYDRKTRTNAWINEIHPLEWQETHHG